MNNTIPIIIIEFNSYERTIKYIKDFINKVLINKRISFIIVDNSIGSENWNGLKSGIEIGFSQYKKKIDILDVKESKRVANGLFIQFDYEKINFDIILIKSLGNYGFAIGNNIGADIAKNIYNPEYIIFSNSDIKFDKVFNLKFLIDIFSRDSQIALIGPKVTGEDMVSQSPCKKLSLWKRWNFNSLIWPINSIFKYKVLNTYNDLISIENDFEVYRIIGAFMIFDFKKFIQINKFDENTFLYAEELIIGEKLCRFNYKTYYCNNEVLIHEQGVSTSKAFNYIKTLRCKFDSEMYYYNKYRNIGQARIKVSKILFEFYLLKLRLINYIRRKIKC